MVYSFTCHTVHLIPWLQPTDNIECYLYNNNGSGNEFTLWNRIKFTMRNKKNENFFNFLFNWCWVLSYVLIDWQMKVQNVELFSYHGDSEILFHPNLYLYLINQNVMVSIFIICLIYIWYPSDFQIRFENINSGKSSQEMLTIRL